MTSSDLWDQETADTYDDHSADMFAPEVLGPTVELLAGLAGSGRALELAVGTGRVGLALASRGVPVSGIELSEPMAAKLREKAAEAGIELPVTIGDMAGVRVEGEFELAYLVFNTISNLRTQDEQVACFANAARHLRSGGRFVIELGVPPLRQLPPGQLARPFAIGDGHLGFDTFDLVSQQSSSHHYWRTEDGSFSYGCGNFRYLWPAECDLMAKMAGMQLEDRFEDWDRSPFTSDSTRHVSIWRKG